MVYGLNLFNFIVQFYRTITGFHVLILVTTAFAIVGEQYIHIVFLKPFHSQTDYFYITSPASLRCGL